MNDRGSSHGGRVEWAWTGRPKPGEPKSGDTCVVATCDRYAMLAVVDGLGHGPRAAEVAETAAAFLREAAEWSPTDLLSACHDRLRGTRGAVLSLAVIDVGVAELAWAGVGNVEGLLVRAAPDRVPAREHLLVRPGVLGFNLPELRVARLPLDPGDLLLFATDGIQPAFTQDVAPLPDPEVAAGGVLGRYARDADDALVLAARWSGGSA